MTYEDLQKKYDNLYIEEMNLYEVSGLKGLYVDGCIAIDKSLAEKEKACILSEEIGHHLTTVGDILDQTVSENRKQEHRARMVAYNIQVGLIGIINAFNADCKNLNEMAECLDVTEEFLRDAIECYRRKYGMCVTVDNYILYFEPSLGVMKMF